jgi:hypothetical protein
MTSGIGESGMTLSSSAGVAFAVVIETLLLLNKALQGSKD